MDLNCPIWSKEGHPFGIMSFTSFLEEWQRKNMISPVRSFTKGQKQHLPGGLKCYLAQPDYKGISEVSFPPIIDIWSQLWLKILAKNACPKTTDVSQNNWYRGTNMNVMHQTPDFKIWRWIYTNVDIDLFQKDFLG